MKLLPYENYYLRSALPPEAVVKRLEAATEPHQYKLFASYSKSYLGAITGTNFRIQRVIAHQNSFLPVITGVIEKEGTGSRIHIKMRMAWLVIIFMSIWLGIAGILGVVLILFQIQSGRFNLKAMTPAGMFAVGYLMCMIGFKTESARSKKFLSELLNESNFISDPIS